MSIYLTRLQLPGAAPAYTSLPDVDEEAKVGSNFDQIARTRTSQLRRGLSWAFHVAVALLALYGFATLVYRHLPASLSRYTAAAARPPPSCNCGETVAEARANGCVYDSLAAAWLPPHCRSEAITAEFEAAGPLPPDRWGNTWGYWADKNQTQPLTVEDVSLLPEAAARGGSGHFFATHEWHVLHCVYYWRKMWEFGKADDRDQHVVEKRYDTRMHIEHCMAMLTKTGVDPNSVAAEAGVALHSDEIHIAKTAHKHEGESKGGKDPYDTDGSEGMGEEHQHHHEHEHESTKQADPYDEEKKEQR